jgi:hypothetical protein
MSDLINVLVWAERPKSCGAFARLVDRHCPNANFHKAEIHEARVCNNVKSVSVADVLTSPLDIINPLIDSNRHLMLSASYHLALQDRWIWLDADFSGDAFNGGATVIGQGYIQLACSHPDLTGLSPDTWEEEAAFQKVMASRAPGDVKQAAVLARAAKEEFVFRDAEDLFLSTCGRKGDGADDAVIHCLMLVSSAAPFPISAIMVSHARAEDLGRDVARCYALLEWGTPIAATFPPGVDILGLEDSFPRYREYAWKPCVTDIRQWLSPRDQTLLDFFAAVTRDDAERCLNLSASAINLLLDDFQREAMINDHRYPDGAVALTAHPRLNLGPFYRFMIESTRPGESHAWLSR